MADLNSEKQLKYFLTASLPASVPVTCTTHEQILNESKMKRTGTRFSSICVGSWIFCLLCEKDFRSVGKRRHLLWYDLFSIVYKNTFHPNNMYLFTWKMFYLGADYMANFSPG